MPLRKDCGLLPKGEARKWKHYWTIRGHTASLEATRRKGFVRCFLTLKNSAAAGVPVDADTNLERIKQ